MFYLDSHCHINDSKFDEDLEETLNRMVDNQVLKCMIVSVNPKEYEKTLLIKSNNIQKDQLNDNTQKFLKNLGKNFNKTIEYFKKPKIKLC